MPPRLTYVFAPFRLNPAGRSLTANEMPLKLGGRAFDTLVALVERRDRMVTKHELLDIVWPRLVVEENNLQVQVVALRKLLGHHAVATIPGRGYRFTLPVVLDGQEPSAADGSADTADVQTAAKSDVAPVPKPPQTIFNLPRRPEPLFGRTDDIAAIGTAISGHRVVTVAGAGGIGKTRVAEAAALAVCASFPGGAWWVELASITDPDLVPSAVARALGLPLPAAASDTLISIVARVGDQSLLVVLDNCEHLLDGVAAFVDTVIAATPQLRVLVTSQELLKVASERIYRLGTLDLPMESTVDGVAQSGSGELLLARIRSTAPGFALTAETAAAATEICRRLDGIPLAIELAAARVPLLGIEGVRALLDERFRMLTAGARVVLRRHQTLRAALEWSHALLSEEERVVFRRLGVFAGGFTLESAQRVADDQSIDAWDVLEHLGALIDKSLVLAEGEPVPRYRLLETTRMYALEQLAAAGETETTTRKHAVAIKMLLSVFELPATRWRSQPAHWAAAAAELDNTRVALQWAEAQEQDSVLGLELASLAFYVFNFAEVVGEGLERMLAVRRHLTEDLPIETRALFLLALARIGTQSARTDSLDAALQAAELYARLGDDQQRYSALVSAVAISGRVDLDLDAQAETWIAQALSLEHDLFPPRLRAMFLWARHRWLIRQGEPELALVHAREQVRLAREGGAVQAALAIEGSNVAYCELATGQTDAALQHSSAALAANGGTDIGAGHILDTLTMCLAVRGELEQAQHMGRRAYADLRRSGDEFMLLDGLAFIGAASGRLRDAVITMALSDAEFAARKFLRWPLSVEWRKRTEVLLADVPIDEMQRWRLEAAHLPASIAREHALGLASTSGTTLR